MLGAKKAILFLLLIFAAFFAPSSTFAQESPSPTPCVTAAPGGQSPCIQVDERQLGFVIPTFSTILTFGIRLFFIIGGLAALVMLLLGSFTWITSGGEKEKVHAAQQKIQAAVMGLIMILVVLAVVVTLEQVVFNGRLCLGLSCGITIPALLKDPNAPASSSSSTEGFQLLDNSPTPAPLSPTAGESPQSDSSTSTSQQEVELRTIQPDPNTQQPPKVPDTGQAE